ncbi:MAG: hypothetical protein HC880_03030 [Bacteroidia bacterium]|nr:hypothetical protein [Bacteroidia bacterium]
MKTPDYISKTKPANPGLDYHYLREQSIRHIQELTGAFWTDYNEHDPGVTMLEQLCYALTDLAYRTDFPIEDHLYQDQHHHPTFHKAPEILPSQPLTIQDYRKLFIDQLPALKNVWMTATGAQENSLSGLYNLYLDLDEESLAPGKIRETIKKITEIYCAHRNLGEDLEEIVVLKPLPVAVYADIEIENIEEIENILAKIFFQINNYLNPEIRFYTLTDLLRQNYSIEQIFEGPRLQHGFIRKEDLSPKLNKIVISEIIRIMMDVEEVVSVKNLYLKVEDEVYENQLNVDKNASPAW